MFGAYVPECGLYEASNLLLGDHLTEKSVTVKWVDAAMLQKRKRRLKSHKKLVEVEKLDPSSTDILEGLLSAQHVRNILLC